MDAELAAIRPWMACGGVPLEKCRSEGTPSLSEGPDAGAEAFGYFGPPKSLAVRAKPPVATPAATAMYTTRFQVHGVSR